jgi:hypothetical protein
LTVYYTVLYLLLLHVSTLTRDRKGYVTFFGLTEYEINTNTNEMLELKHVGAINIEQYDKLSIKCAFVCSLYIYSELSIFRF